jgi:hypothetical protein
MTHLPLKTLIREKNARVLSHIFKMASLFFKTLIKEKNARVWSICSRQEQGNSRSYIAEPL